MKPPKDKTKPAAETARKDAGHSREPELDIQKQWACVPRGTEFRLSNGGTLRVLSAGTWNRMAGPDFRNAKLELNGVTLRGDIEVHGKTTLRRATWRFCRRPRSWSCRKRPKKMKLRRTAGPPRAPDSLRK